MNSIIYVIECSCTMLTFIPNLLIDKLHSSREYSWHRVNLELYFAVRIAISHIWRNN